jgi:ketosteroid isomerase-like protein
MSQENLETVRAAASAYNRGDLETLIQAYDPAVEFVTLLLGTHHGRQAIRSVFEENRTNLAGYSLELEELIDAGPDKVVAVARLGGAGRVSQIALGDPIAFVATFKAGLIVRQETFRNRDEALEAAGISKQRCRRRTWRSCEG